MSTKWTADRIALLSSVDLKQLATNAQDRGNNEVLTLCQTEIQARKPIHTVLGQGFVA